MGAKKAATKSFKKQAKEDAIDISNELKDQADQNSSDDSSGSDDMEMSEDVDSSEDSAHDEDDSSDEEEQEEADTFPLKKKSKMSKHDDGSSGFSSAVNAILSSHLKSYDRKDPIMARNKKVLKQNDADKLEQKARKQITNEKKKLLEKSWKKDIIPVASSDNSGENVREVLEKEAKLRKIAQKGAVKLFNAIMFTQVKTEKEVSTSLSDVKNKQTKKELITEVSKEKFFDLVKAAGDEEH